MIYSLIFLMVTVLGGLLGLSIGWLMGRGWSDRPVGPPPPDIDADTERAIQDAAMRWASAHGRPWLAPLIADKLRLAYRLRQRFRGPGSTGL